MVVLHHVNEGVRLSLVPVAPTLSEGDADLTTAEVIGLSVGVVGGFGLIIVIILYVYCRCAHSLFGLHFSSHCCLYFQNMY